jgi:hypothetical protein
MHLLLSIGLHITLAVLYSTKTAYGIDGFIPYLVLVTRMLDIQMLQLLC